MLCCRRLESTPGVAVGDVLEDDRSVRAEFVVDHRFQPLGLPSPEDPADGVRVIG
jgi:hypothetical protein